MSTEGMTRMQAIEELRECYEALGACEQRYNCVSASQYGYIGRETALEDTLIDAKAYSDRAIELERFLASRANARRETQGR